MRGAAENAAGCATDKVHIITNISTVVTRDSSVKNYTMQSSAQCIQVWQSPTPSEGPQLTRMVIGSPELATTNQDMNTMELHIITLIIKQSYKLVYQLSETAQRMLLRRCYR